MEESVTKAIYEALRNRFVHEFSMLIMAVFVIL